MSRLDITADNIRTGNFTDQQLSGAAGFPVAVLYMSELPHWDLLKQNATLSDKALRLKMGPQLIERAEAISQRLQKIGGSIADINPQSLAEARYPIISSKQFEINIPGERPTLDFGQNVSRHWQDVRARGIDAVTDDERVKYFGPKPGETLPYVFTGLLSEPLQPYVNKAGWEQLFKKTATVMLVHSNADPEDFKKVWALEIGLPVERITKFPDPKIHHLISMGHEVEHLPQTPFEAVDTSVEDNTYLPEYFIPKYYEEADADLSIHSKLRRVDFGAKDKIDEALTMDRHKRYMGLFTAQPHYWTAPFMDAVEKRETPPDFYQVHQSVMEIRLRIMAEADRMQVARDGGVMPAPVTSKEINETVAGWRKYPGAMPYLPDNPKQIAGIDLRSDRMVELKLLTGDIRPGIDNAYLEWRERQFFKQPEVFYTILKKSLTEGAFDSNPLTKKIAGKMVEAAEYFDTTLTRAANVQNLVDVPRPAFPQNPPNSAALVQPANDLLPTSPYMGGTPANTGMVVPAGPVWR